MKRLAGVPARVRVRLRVCDDSTGALTALVSQRLILLRRTTFRALLKRSLPGLQGPCSSYELEWTVPPRFRSGGRYEIRIQVEDSGGRRSNVVVRSFSAAP